MGTENGVPPRCVTQYGGAGNLSQVVLKRALIWNKATSMSKTYHPSTFKTKVIVDVEGRVWTLVSATTL